jgi:hypothetical protein
MCTVIALNDGSNQYYTQPETHIYTVRVTLRASIFTRAAAVENVRLCLMMSRNFTFVNLVLVGCYVNDMKIIN